MQFDVLNRIALYVPYSGRLCQFEQVQCHTCRKIDFFFLLFWVFGFGTRDLVGAEIFLLPHDVHICMFFLSVFFFLLLPVLPVIVSGGQ